MTETPVASNSEDGPRRLALLKAVGLDRANPEQRELAFNIAKRYELDLLLKHLILVEGRAYITRDGLLHIAHRSGQLDGIETTEPVLADGFWRATASVYRKDMSRPFTYYGRYPENGTNKKFGPEMATKVAEVMSLRRAFDVAAPTAEERWDTEVPAQEPPRAPASLAERVQQRRAEVVPETPAAPLLGEPMPLEESDRLPVLCGNMDADLDTGECELPVGHVGAHRNEGGVWPAAKK